MLKTCLKVGSLPLLDPILTRIGSSTVRSLIGTGRWWSFDHLFPIAKLPQNGGGSTSQTPRRDGWGQDSVGKRLQRSDSRDPSPLTCPYRRRPASGGGGDEGSQGAVAMIEGEAPQ